jgi:hypothetical protein
VDLYLTLAALSSGGLGGELGAGARAVLEPAMNACAEVVALGSTAAMAEDPTSAGAIPGGTGSLLVEAGGGSD